MLFVVLFFFFFKQKTAYEMRISDWSSDVCSSDLMVAKHSRAVRTGENRLGHVLADLAPADVPRRDDIDIARPVSGHIPVAEADSCVCPPIGIFGDALNERTGTVPTTDDCSLYSHAPLSIHTTSHRHTLFTYRSVTSSTQTSHLSFLNF